MSNTLKDIDIMVNEACKALAEKRRETLKL